VDWLYNLAWIVISVALLLLFLTAELLDWKGRLEIIEKNWPRIWSTINNRPARILLLLFFVGLVGKDIKERLDEPKIDFKVVMPSIPAPVIEYSQPPTPQSRPAKKMEPAATETQFIVTQKRMPTTRPDAPNHIQVTVATTSEFLSLRLLLKCTEPIIEASGGILAQGVSAGLPPYQTMFQSGVNPNDRTSWAIMYGSSSPAFGPSNPIVVDVWSAVPNSCKNASTF
jgi:hypothetical protein